MKIALRLTEQLTAAQAIAWEFDGIELPWQSPAAAGIPVACVSCDIAMTGHRRADREGVAKIERAVSTASDLACPLVKILDTSAHGDLSALALRTGRWLADLSDTAAHQKVTLLVENRLTLRNARDIWLTLEAAARANLAAAWDLDTASLAGESPAVSVPALNSRIGYAQLRWQQDAANIDAMTFIHGLRGIGYQGWLAVAVTADRATEALTMLRHWCAER